MLIEFHLEGNKTHGADKPFKLQTWSFKSSIYSDRTRRSVELSLYVLFYKMINKGGFSKLQALGHVVVANLWENLEGSGEDYEQASMGQEKSYCKVWSKMVGNTIS